MLAFNKKKDFLTIEEILKITGGEVEADLNLKIYDVKPIHLAKKGEATFFTNAKYAKFLNTTEATICFVDKNITNTKTNNTILFKVQDSYLAFALILQAFYGASEIEDYLEHPEGYKAPSVTIKEGAQVSKTARIFENVVIGKNVKIGENVVIMPNSIIGSNVIIADNCIIYDNTTLMFCEIGENSIIRSGARIGSSGFGFVPNFINGKHTYIPQISKVLIGKNVDIGANTTIDRGCLENTIIEDNVKIDNLVQVAHGVTIKTSTFMAGQSGIGGSAEIGKFVFMGAQSGVAPHIKVADFTQIIGKSGVVGDVVEPKTIIAGMPAISRIKWHKAHILVQKLLSKNK